jgi:hypothetical protein
MATYPYMPIRGQSCAPTFDPAKPRELRRYFDTLDSFFTSRYITSDAKKKKFACYYLDLDSAELWEVLPQYEATVPYSDFVQAVYRLYPGSEADRRWTIADMDALIGEQLRLGIPDLASFGTYHRSFVTITHFLRSKHKISDTEQSRAFI